ncbi:hypothetical protein D3C78_1517200 [compost metagenome]
MQRMELRQARNQPAHRQRRLARYRQRRRGGRLQLRYRLLQGVQRLAAGGKQPGAGGTEKDRAVAALEQRHAQLLFQQADLAADRAVRHAQLVSRAHEAAVAGSGLEHAQGVQRRQCGKAHRSVFLT